MSSKKSKEYRDGNATSGVRLDQFRVQREAREAGLSANYREFGAPPASSKTKPLKRNRVKAAEKKGGKREPGPLG